MDPPFRGSLLCRYDVMGMNYWENVKSGQWDALVYMDRRMWNILYVHLHIG